MSLSFVKFLKKVSLKLRNFEYKVRGRKWLTKLSFAISKRVTHSKAFSNSMFRILISRDSTCCVNIGVVNFRRYLSLALSGSSFNFSLMFDTYLAASKKFFFTVSFISSMAFRLPGFSPDSLSLAWPSKSFKLSFIRSSIF